MTFDSPGEAQIPQLLSLWKSVFGDWNGFWETFLETGFSPDRCRCILEDGRITAALTWLDCTCEGQKMAYIYAVVTDPACRGQGLCRRLMTDTHKHLQDLGYAAALLVPAEESLRGMYEKMGYRTCTHVAEFESAAGSVPVPLRAIGPEEFAALRRRFLPPSAVLQEQENLAFLSRQAQFYTGVNVLMAAYSEDRQLTAMELLGDRAAASGILRTLDCQKGRFRCPGTQIPFAMMHALIPEAAVPSYFGFAFD